MTLIRFLMRSSWRVVITAIAAGTISGASSAFLIGLINTTLTTHGANPTRLVEAFVALGVVMLSSSITSQLMLIRLSQGAIYELRLQLSRQILGAPLRGLEEIGAPRLLAALTEDVNDIANALLNIPTLCIFATTIVVCLIYLTWLSWSLLVMALVCMVIGIGTFQFMLVRAFGQLEEARQRQDGLFGHFRAVNEGTKELKLHRERRNAFFAEELTPTAKSFKDLNVKGLSLYAVARGWGDFLFFVFIGLVLFALPHFKIVGSHTTTGAALIVLYMMTPLTIIMNTLPVFGRATVALNNVETLGLSLPRNAEDLDRAREPAALPWGNLELKGVTHTYHREREDSKFQLGPINLTIPRGELVFLVGGNGSGKTTLAKIITGLYSPEAGEIRLDGRSIGPSEVEAFRQCITAVFSDFYLFESLLGVDLTAVKNAAQQYLALLHLDHKVRIEGSALSTTDLSQGQRKRLALLTAYLEDRPFYLFDEWAADQDPIFKEIFYTTLLPDLKAKGKTVLVITHDDKYFHVADRVVKLDDGQLQATAASYPEVNTGREIRVAV